MMIGTTIIRVEGKGRGMYSQKYLSSLSKLFNTSRLNISPELGRGQKQNVNSRNCHRGICQLQTGASLPHAYRETDE